MFRERQAPEEPGSLLRLSLTPRARSRSVC
jgi:hypothetical protein